MKFKKALLSSMALAMAMPGAVFANTTTSQPGVQQVQLYSEVVSSYTVTLPKKVDVTAESVQFDVKVQGNIAGDEKVSVTMSPTAVLKETVTGSGVAHKDINLAIEWAKPDFNHDTIVGAGETRKATVSHSGVVVPAGSWTVDYPITIALNPRA